MGAIYAGMTTPYNKQNTESYNIFSDETRKQIELIRIDALWNSAMRPQLDDAQQQDTLAVPRYRKTRLVIVASCFDLLHPGHVLMLEDAASKGEHLVVCLHTDPTINRDSKNKPVQSLEERRIMVRSMKMVNSVVEYATEDDLLNILRCFTSTDSDLDGKDELDIIRVLGSDWRGKPFTGHDLPGQTFYFHERNHDWSTSGLRRRIYQMELEQHQRLLNASNTK